MDRPKLSERTRTALEERLRTLEEERIPHLQLQRSESEDPAVEAALAAAEEEATRVRRTLATAGRLEDEPHDARLVELGDTVTVREEGSPDAQPERFTLVGELEARVDDSWISTESPMGSALLGSRLGETVQVETPVGVVRYTIAAIEGT